MFSSGSHVEYLVAEYYYNNIIYKYFHDLEMKFKT